VWFLGAEYIAITQLLVYAGAVSILTIFTVMVTHRSHSDASRDTKPSWSALALAVALFALVAVGILTSPSLSALSTAAEPLDLATFGALMFSPNGHTLAFEIASLVLLVALIAAVHWSAHPQLHISASSDTISSDTGVTPLTSEKVSDSLTCEAVSTQIAHPREEHK
jgi:NADH:ubiquinone oxidoreductase subunit 6 (subunit J)